MSPAIIHLIRHGQGFHQLDPESEHRQIPDPALTEQGVARCKVFCSEFPRQNQVGLICASPLRRTILTARYCFAPLITQMHPITLLPYAQEDTAEPCDTGSSLALLRKEFKDFIDVTNMSEGWDSKQGIYEPRLIALKQRARELRCWLRNRAESEVVVVGHGSFWHWVTEEVDEDGSLTGE